MPSAYSGYAAMVRFVVEKTTPTDKTMGDMLDLVRALSLEIDRSGRFDVKRDQAEAAARGFAGIARFLQEHILPEALHHQNEPAIQQVKYGIEASLALAAELVKQLNDEDLNDRATFGIEVPPPSANEN